MQAAIAGWGTAVPDQRLTNADLERRVDTTDAWIVERTGIRERRVVRDDETTASLAIEAGAAAIKHAGLTPDAIDLLIVATATPEQPIPHTGAFVGEGIGLRCGSFDLGAGCAGFVYELVTGAALITGGGFENVLIIGAETLTRIIDPNDRGTCVLFGDAAASMVLARSSSDHGMLSFDLGCDGSAAALLEVHAGGSRKPATPETIAAGEQYLKMQGQEVFRRAVRVVVDSARATLERAGLEASDIDWFVPHQANIRIIDAAASRLGVPKERTVVNIERFGNTSAASIPMACSEAAEDGRLEDGDLVLMSGFGAGMTWEARWCVGDPRDTNRMKVALVTGASRGIGRAIARALGAGGHRVACAYSSDEGAAKETCALVEQAGGEAISVKVDVCDPAAVDAAYKEIEDAWGPVEVLVNNAGITADGLIARMSDEQWGSVLTTNLDGAFHTIRRATPKMMRARWGRIVNVSSVSGHAGAPGQANYSAAKAGLLGLTRAVARELAPRGITCNVVAPGPIVTAMTDEMPAEWRGVMEAAVPLGRLGSPDEVAAVVGFLCSEPAAYVTGALVPVDGGLGMGH